MPNQLINHVFQAEICPGYKSDHSRITLTLKLSSLARGRGLWQLNETYLSNQDYVNMINNSIDEFLENNAELNPTLKWDMIKMNLREKSISFATKKAHGRNQLVSLLELRLAKLNKKMDNESNDVNIKLIAKDIERTENLIQDEQEHKTQAIIFRSKCKWYLLGERNTKYYLNLEKKRYHSKNITQLYDKCGNLLTHPKDILCEQARYFQELYTSSPKTQFPYVNINDPKINVVDQLVVDRPLSIDEFTYALKGIKKSSCPGCDGFSARFYVMFWGKIKDVYFEAIQYALDEGRLHDTARCAILCLLQKPNKLPLYLPNLRGLSILNVDYRLYSAILCHCLKSVIKKIVHKDQTGFIKDRFIANNIRHTLDIIQITQQKKIQGAILSINFNKCYDWIEWFGIEKALTYFNFGDNFMNMIHILYKDPLCCSMNYGFTSEWWSPQ